MRPTHGILRPHPNQGTGQATDAPQSNASARTTTSLPSHTGNPPDHATHTTARRRNAQEPSNSNLHRRRQSTAPSENRMVTRSQARLMQMLATTEADSGNTVGRNAMEVHTLNLDTAPHTPPPYLQILPPAAPRAQRHYVLSTTSSTQQERDDASSSEADEGAWQLRAPPQVENQVQEITPQPLPIAPSRSIFQSMLVALPEFGNHLMARFNPPPLPARSDSPVIGWWNGRPLADAVMAWNGTSEEDDSAGLDLATWREIESEAGRRTCRSFSIFLDRLQETKEYKSEATRPNMQQRVKDLLMLLQQDDQEDLRSLYFALAPDAISLCGDRIALKFDDMELAALNHQAEQGKYSTTELLNIGLQMFQLECLKKIAREKSREIAREERSIEYREALEVELAYRVKLGEEPELNLPTRSKSMLYEFCSRLSQTDISNAKQQILDAYHDKHQTTQFLIHWLPWAKQLERKHPEEFSNTNRHIHAEQNKIFEDLDMLEERKERNEISHAIYKIEAEALQSRYSQIEAEEMDKLKIRLTQSYHHE